MEARLLELKADVIKEIFAILPKICQDNPDNQKHLFDLLPQIKFLVSDCVIIVVNIAYQTIRSNTLTRRLTSS